MRLFIKFLILFFILFHFCGKMNAEKRDNMESTYRISVTYKLSKNENLEKILLWRIPFLRPSSVYYFLSFFGKHLNARKLKPGDKFIFDFDENYSLKNVIYIRKDSPYIYYNFKKINGEYVFKKVKQKIKIDTVVYDFYIQNNLFDALNGVSKGDFLADYVSKIFSWTIDFNTEIRKGDRMILICEKKYIDEEFFDYGKIFYISYYGKYVGRKEAVYFKGKYYDSLGNSLDKYFLRSPLPYGRITSYFTKRRFHPILRIYRPHHGLDYGAPAGAKVMSIADGRVIFAGWKRGYGFFIQIKHKNGDVTGYGHLKRIRRGIKKGVYVKQGEIIGYVGSTGLSTGPHLHFEIRKNGRFINFLRIKPDSKTKLTSKEMKEFKKIYMKWKKKINEISVVLSL